MMDHAAIFQYFAQSIEPAVLASGKIPTWYGLSCTGFFLLLSFFFLLKLVPFFEKKNETFFSVLKYVQFSIVLFHLFHPTNRWNDRYDIETKTPNNAPVPKSKPIVENWLRRGEDGLTPYIKGK